MLWQLSHNRSKGWRLHDFHVDIQIRSRRLCIHSPNTTYTGPATVCTISTPKMTYTGPATVCTISTPKMTYTGPETVCTISTVVLKVVRDDAATSTPWQNGDAVVMLMPSMFPDWSTLTVSRSVNWDSYGEHCKTRDELISILYVFNRFRFFKVKKVL